MIDERSPTKSEKETSMATITRNTRLNQNDNWPPRSRLWFIVRDLEARVEREGKTVTVKAERPASCEACAAADRAASST